MLIENQFNLICRTCLTPEISDDTSSSLYSVIDLENGDVREISKIIENCINLEITNAEYLPQVICNKCTSMIRNFYVFRYKCHKNDTYLREQADAWKIKYEVKADDTVQSVLDVEISSVEEVKIFELSEIERTGQENFEKNDYHEKEEINIFEDCPDDRLYDDRSTDYDEDTKGLIFKKQTLISDEALEPSKKLPKTKDLLYNDHNIDEEDIQDDQRKIFHKCDICFEMFDNRKELLFHRRANHINEISEEYYTIVKKDNKTHYICKICKRFCKHKNILRVHLRSHTGEKPYKCAVCSQSFAQKWHSRKHMEIHNLETIEKKPAIFYKCGSCKEGFESEIAVKIHYEKHHPPTQEKDKVRMISKPVEKLCDICGKFMKDLTEHLRWHAGKKKYECKICGRILSTPSSLSQHRQRHSEEKKFICDTCGKSFKIQHDLTFHRKIHFEERKHECQLCGRKFLHKVRLRIHLKVHAGEKPYQIYDNRKREKKRLQRMEMIKNGISLPKPKPRKKKEKISSKQMENSNPPVQMPLDLHPMFRTSCTQNIETNNLNNLLIS